MTLVAKQSMLEDPDRKPNLGFSVGDTPTPFRRGCSDFIARSGTGLASLMAWTQDRTKPVRVLHLYSCLVELPFGGYPALRASPFRMHGAVHDAELGLLHMALRASPGCQSKTPGPTS